MVSPLLSSPGAVLLSIAQIRPREVKQLAWIDQLGEPSHRQVQVVSTNSELALSLIIKVTLWWIPTGLSLHTY